MSISKSVVESKIREDVFSVLDMQSMEGFKKISNQSYGTTVEDMNGEIRMVEIRLVVRKIDEDMDGGELLDWEADEYQTSLAEKAEKAKERAEEKKRKIAKSEKARAERAAKRAAKEAEAEE